MGVFTAAIIHVLQGSEGHAREEVIYILIESVRG